MSTLLIAQLVSFMIDAKKVLRQTTAARDRVKHSIAAFKEMFSV